MNTNRARYSRRSFFKKSAAATAAVAAGSLLTNADLDAITGRVNTNSQPSDLKITDMRVVDLYDGYRPIIRIDTNQGLHGYGEVRDNGSKMYALMLKRRIMGENPCNVDKIFRKIKQFGGDGRQGGGVFAVEMACWDLAGKAWGVPVWQLLDGKFRDRMPLYADNPGRENPVEMAKVLQDRMNRGFKYLKMDMNPRVMYEKVDGALAYAEGVLDPYDFWGSTYENTRSAYVPHPFTGFKITKIGLKHIEDYCATVRDIVGWKVHLAGDQFGHFMTEDSIKIARTLDQFNFAWYEDMVPWIYPDRVKRLKEACTTPILTGEDIYLKEGFMKLFEMKAISIAQPDPGSVGGLLEAKKVGDLAMEHGIAFALHMAGTPCEMLACAHIAAATDNFLCCEHHSIDDEMWDPIVTGPSKPIVKSDGCVEVPNTPGLGFELNEEHIKKNMLKDPDKEYFAPTPEWDDEKSHDRLWSMHIPKKNYA